MKTYQQNSQGLYFYLIIYMYIYIFFMSCSIKLIFNHINPGGKSLIINQQFCKQLCELNINLKTLTQNSKQAGRAKRPAGRSKFFCLWSLN